MIENLFYFWNYCIQLLAKETINQIQYNENRAISNLLLIELRLKHINYKKNHLFILTSALIFSSLMSSCSNDDDNKITFDEKTFTNEWKEWKEIAPNSYTFSYDYFSSGSGPISCTVTICNGLLESAINTINNEGDIPFKDISEVYSSVNFIYQDIRNGEIPSYANSVTIHLTYDSTHHFISSVNYDVDYNEDILGGGYYSFKMTNFEILDK